MRVLGSTLVAFVLRHSPVFSAQTADHRPQGMSETRTARRVVGVFTTILMAPAIDFVLAPDLIALIA